MNSLELLEKTMEQKMEFNKAVDIIYHNTTMTKRKSKRALLKSIGKIGTEEVTRSPLYVICNWLNNVTDKDSFCTNREITSYPLLASYITSGYSSVKRDSVMRLLYTKGTFKGVPNLKKWSAPRVAAKKHIGAYSSYNTTKPKVSKKRGVEIDTKKVSGMVIRTKGFELELKFI